jgi:hypothetical protein
MIDMDYAMCSGQHNISCKCYASAAITMRILNQNHMVAVSKWVPRGCIADNRYRGRSPTTK